MLSHHEIATLLVVASMPTQADIRRADFYSLLERGLVHVEASTRGKPRAQISTSGQQLMGRLNSAFFRS
ncbi:hypothetical protein [Paraburkholderia ferrariae]|uniref:hypothetical protein n=1 Tax=Paraburkholderia ferrariae TaxID=386056 RepID=UPI0004891E35|nr:hypothetical protein [Paraburkholderia ferrariae]